MTNKLYQAPQKTERQGYDFFGLVGDGTGKSAPESDLDPVSTLSDTITMYYSDPRCGDYPLWRIGPFVPYLLPFTPIKATFPVTPPHRDTLETGTLEKRQKLGAEGRKLVEEHIKRFPLAVRSVQTPALRLVNSDRLAWGHFACQVDAVGSPAVSWGTAIKTAFVTIYRFLFFGDAPYDEYLVRELYLEAMTAHAWPDLKQE
ncbi:hypothetical protein MNV49_006975 [Pseudohyphozyma bogoriensis]|nr:hypothetical protein MNV49_006975 [Pseudohyphozyma bogoriensis]